MTTENVNEVCETLTESLDNTQKNATDTCKLVQQVEDMSGKSLHEETVRAILADDKTPMEEKLRLIHQENADYDLHEDNNTVRVERLQDRQTDNVSKATSWWGQNWGLVVVAGVALFVGVTPGGRRLLTTAVKSLAA